MSVRELDCEHTHMYLDEDHDLGQIIRDIAILGGVASRRQLERFGFYDRMEFCSSQAGEPIDDFWLKRIRPAWYDFKGRISLQRARRFHTTIVHSGISCGLREGRLIRVGDDTYSVSDAGRAWCLEYEPARARKVARETYSLSAVAEEILELSARGTHSEEDLEKEIVDIRWEPGFTEWRELFRIHYNAETRRIFEAALELAREREWIIGNGSRIFPARAGRAKLEQESNQLGFLRPSDCLSISDFCFYNFMYAMMSVVCWCQGISVTELTDSNYDDDRDDVE